MYYSRPAMYNSMLLMCLLSIEAHYPTHAWASDAQSRIVYTQFEDNQWDIFTSELDGSGRFQVTDSPEREIEPVWSPTGDWIAYTFLNPELSDQYNQYWNGQHLFDFWIVRPDGTDKRKIVSGVLFAPSFSPDGALVAISRPKGDWNGFYCTFDRFDTVILDVQSGSETIVIEDTYAYAWLQQSKTLVLRKSDGTWTFDALDGSLNKQSSIDKDWAFVTGSTAEDKLFWLDWKHGANETTTLIVTDHLANNMVAVRNVPELAQRLWDSEHVICVPHRHFARSW